MNEITDKLIKAAKSIYLTLEEKSEMVQILRDHLNKAPLRSSWFYFLSYRTVLVGALVLVLILSSLTWFSQKAVPGDTLYSTKLTSEKVLGSLAMGDTAQLQIKTATALERLNEAEQLASRDELDSTKENQLEASFFQISEETLASIQPLQKLTVFKSSVAEKPEIAQDTETPKSSDKKNQRQIEIKADFESRLKNYRDSLSKNQKRPDRLIASLDSVISRLQENKNNESGNSENKQDQQHQSVFNLIKITSPQVGDLVSSPVSVGGEARGNWYFEASFPVQVLDEDGTMLGQEPAQAQGEWMTTDFVPFEAKIEFSKPKGSIGTIVFKKDNPSGLPQNDTSVSVPVKFK